MCGGIRRFYLKLVQKYRAAPTTPPGERNKTSVILLRSLGQKKQLGEFPSEPLPGQLRPRLRRRLRTRSQSQQNNGFVSFTYQTVSPFIQMVLFQDITRRPRCQLLREPLPDLRRRFFAASCISAIA